MPRPLSDSWQYFTLLESQNGKGKKARCSFCGLEKAASITRLHQHLLSRCLRIDSKIREELRQKEEEDNEPKQQQHHQQQQHYSPGSSSPPLPPPPPPPPRTQTILPLPPKTPFIRAEAMPEQAMLDWYLARALFSSNIPFEVIENPHMIELFRHLQPNYTVPDPRRLQQYLLKEQHWDLIKKKEGQNSITEQQQQQQYHHHQHHSQQKHNRMGSSSSSSTRMSPEDLEGNL